MKQEKSKNYGILSLILIAFSLTSIIFLPSLALADNSTSNSNSTAPIPENSTSISEIEDVLENYTEPIIENYTEPEITSEPIVENYTEPEDQSVPILIHTIQTDKSTYNYDEIIHVTGKSSLVYRIQITQANGDNIYDPKVRTLANNSYEYDINLISHYNGGHLKKSSNYNINALDKDHNVLTSTVVYIFVPEQEPEPIILSSVENYTEPITNSTESIIENFSKSITSTKQVNTIFSDKATYENGSPITIKGIFETDLPYLDLYVYNPSNLNIAAEKIQVTKTSEFEKTFDTSNYLWYENGMYEFQVGDKNGNMVKLEVQVVESSENVTPQITPILEQPISSPEDNVTNNGDYKISELIEENQMLKEENKELKDTVDYLSNLIESIQEFFGGIFT